MAILSPIDSPIQQYDPTQPLRTPNGVLPPIMSAGEIANSPAIAQTADEIGKRGLLNHQLGKDIFNAEKPPDPTAAPGTIDWYKQRQDQLEYGKDHPWGSPVSAHPGVLGKILHGLSVAGNVAGDVIEPGIMANVPGTELHNRLEEGVNAAGEQRAEEIANQTKTAESGAENAEASTTRAGAEKENADIEQKRLEQSIEQAGQPKTSFEKLTDGSIVQLSTDPHTGNSSAKLLYKGDPKVETDLADLQLNGKLHKVLVNKQTGETIKDLGETKEPSGGNSNLIVTPGGQVEQVKPGMTLAPGTQNLSGFASLNRPTTQERNVSDQAKIASQAIPGVISEINGLKDQLGPVAGNWNAFMQGKLGLDNPKFAGLRADLLMLSSAVALAHARGRLPENLREEFDNAINAPKQTPENLVSVLQHIAPWMDRMGQMGAIDKEPTRPSNVPDGYIFKDGPKGKGWYKP